jgi:predicted N-acetyltransferase YhbS
MSVELRAPTPADADACGDILYRAFRGVAEKFNMPFDFASPEVATGFAKMLTTPGSGFFGIVAEENGRVVGSNFLDERTPVSGVGPVTVDPACQSRGIGRRLMEAVLHRAGSQNTASVRLVQEAYNAASMSLYTSMGFDTKEPLVLMTGRPKSKPGGNGDVRPMQESDLSQCATLCRKIHGYDRTGELRGTLAAKMFRPYVLDRHGRIVAYASGPEYFVLNHGVAETQQELQELLLGAAMQNDKPLSMLVPTRRSDFFRWCISEGLRVMKPMTLMSMGDYREPAGAFYPSVEF